MLDRRVSRSRSKDISPCYFLALSQLTDRDSSSRRLARLQDGLGVHITIVSSLFVVAAASTRVLALVPWGVDLCFIFLHDSLL